jgi:hypothetical protein
MSAVDLELPAEILSHPFPSEDFCQVSPFVAPDFEIDEEYA